jgi:hypothetical protein
MVHLLRCLFCFQRQSNELVLAFVRTFQHNKISEILEVQKDFQVYRREKPEKIERIDAEELIHYGTYRSSEKALEVENVSASLF